MGWCWAIVVVCVKVRKGDVDGLIYCGQQQHCALSPSDDAAPSLLCPTGLVDDGGDVEGCG